MAAMIESYVDKVVQIVTNDGRNIVGVLKGFDQTTNVILEDCNERVFSSTAGVEQVALGLYIVRGDNIAVVGEIDQEADAALQLDDIMAEPLKPVVH
ncbi:u6 snRNA-associated sm-like protein lsm8 [Chrysochromulina tobinii]|uniref:U6 snRNA-associated Sm-like protein LSm8 n=1 Tax=Chrysochromulina tobinii TaxID=1460289 RepID=A0A0M0JV94_9EUKA|nr:u6 snRNA-associated sm-like protein lsm8 [Chrysochromulina tobinii]|eukprot:KOO30048.1 u6 snRNA-associated sm-like protein lsm8 [Chrysochromulina sp. CCMP291]